MPYIDKSSRHRLENTCQGGKSIEEIGRKIKNPGEFNYVVTRLAHLYLETNGQNYQHYNDILGALEGVKLELYRRHTSKYEDIKIAENGDV